MNSFYPFFTDGRTEQADAEAAEQRQKAAVQDELQRHTEEVARLNALHDKEREAFEQKRRQVESKNEPA